MGSGRNIINTPEEGDLRKCKEENDRLITMLNDYINSNKQKEEVEREIFPEVMVLQEFQSLEIECRNFHLPKETAW